MTSLLEERTEQKKWKDRTNSTRKRSFEALVVYEFLPFEIQQKRQYQLLRGILEHSYRTIPHYQKIFQKARITPNDISSINHLKALPILGKQPIFDNPNEFISRAWQKSEALDGYSKSSGTTTGTPLRIYRSKRSRFIELMMLQRQFRWYRFDPREKMAWIRKGTEIHVLPDLHTLQPGETTVMPDWPGLGEHFHTGETVVFSASNTLNEKVEWLNEHQPTYLRAMSSELEHIALAMQGHPHVASIKGLRAVGESITRGVEDRIKSAFKAESHISYGLNELGWIATKCSEGDRYHIHAERCLVEVVREDGTACDPGEFGRVLITTFDNVIMPVIRYDTGDMAQAMVDSCPCGRTLPSIGSTIERAHIMKALPESTLSIVIALRHIMEYLPASLSGSLRAYQIVHTKLNHISLRLFLSEALSLMLEEYINRKWGEIGIEHPSDTISNMEFSIEIMDHISRTNSGKFLYFDTELTTE